MIDFPANPTVGQVFTSGAQSWTWDGAKWVASGVYVGPPQFNNDNRIINGDMRIDQRNNGAVTTPVSGAYVIDRWKIGLAQASKFTTQSVAGGAVLASLGFGYFFSAVSTSAYASIATDNFNLQQVIEADMISDFRFGTANAQPITLSFWVNTNSLTGTFSGAIVNIPTTRSYPFTFSIPAVNTWTKIVITIPGDTAGTWVMSGNAAGLIVRFDLGSGANFRSSAGSWQAGNFTGATGAVSTVGTNGAGLNLTGVKLEIGSVATPFNRQSLAKSMADCQRYYQVGTSIQSIGGNSWVAGWGNQHTFMFPVLPRAAPTMTTNVSGQTNCSATSVTPLASGQGYNHNYTITAATGGAASNCTWTANAEL